ncbi:MAG TPA: sugar transferase [Terriglobales bacterium]|nr:sugar transferase [Terriglobales bacterium]
MKRVFDVICAGIGLLVLMPVLALCAVAVRVTSPGPIIFRQERVGLYGNTFEILKFRTMRVTTTGRDPQITVGRDPRITRVGALLRKWKLDELPQLWNVVTGDMSLVGPRPEVPKYVAIYPSDQRDLILSVRPGITDPCSVHLRDESDLLSQADDPENFYVGVLLPEKLRMSGDYVRNRSFVSDVGIIVKTIGSVVGFGKKMP